jgi:hypothetical protein
MSGQRHRRKGDRIEHEIVDGHLQMELTAVKRAIALAKLTLFGESCERLARFVAEGVIGRRDAADWLYDMAVGNRLVDTHGDELIGQMLSTAFDLPEDPA